MGSPDFAVPTLDALVDAGHEVVAAYTQPPRPAGRGKGERPTAVELRAHELGIHVRSPKSLRGQADLEEFTELDADIAVVAAYGLILPQPILDAPMLGCLNVHASLLPRWRGAAPVQRAIMAGDEATGVTIMQMEAGLDTGPMLLKRALEIEDNNAVLDDLPRFEPIPQPEDGATYAAKITKDEARIDWSRPATDLVRHIQGLAPFPGAWFEVDGERIKLLAATEANGTGAPGEVLDDQLTIACGDGALQPTQVQRAGKGAMCPDELLRGFSIPKGTILR